MRMNWTCTSNRRGMSFSGKPPGLRTFFQALSDRFLNLLRECCLPPGGVRGGSYGQVIALFLLSVLTLACQPTGGDTRPPNIILILADDMGYSDLGCTGGEIPTPHLDRLAAGGLLMPNFYNAARCCPTRAALMTGLYPHQAGMGDMVEGRLRKDSTFLPAYQGWLSQNAVTIAEVLQQAGYQTYLSGKWHLGNDEPHWPDNRGFERTFAMIHGAGNYFNDEPWASKDQFRRLHVDGEEFQPGEGFYMTDAITDFALRFMEEGEREKPFFLYLSYTAPHWPLHALPEDIEKFEGRYTQGWHVLRKERFERMKALGVIPEHAALAPEYVNVGNPILTPAWDTLPAESRATWARRMAVYAAQVYSMDRAIGRVVDYLEEQGELDNTLILFLSDNGATHAAIYLATSFIADRSGPIGSARSFDSYGARWGNMSNTPYPLFKLYTAEGGIKTPLIAHYPKGIEPNTVSVAYGHVIDLLPTCLELAGVEYPETYNGHPIQPAEGISLAPAFRGAALPAGRPLFWEHHGNYAVRKGKWKLLNVVDAKDAGGDRLQLFGLDSDPSESRDVSAQHPEMVRELQRLYQEWTAWIGVEPFNSLILARPI